MFAFAASYKINLASAGRPGSGIFAAHAEQNQFRYIAKIETDTSAVGTAVFTDLVPDYVGLVGESPSRHDR